MSVAVYNHYKRVRANITKSVKYNREAQSGTNERIGERIAYIYIYRCTVWFTFTLKSLSNVIDTAASENSNTNQVLKVGGIAYVSPRTNNEQRWKAKQVSGTLVFIANNHCSIFLRVRVQYYTTRFAFPFPPLILGI